MDEIRDIKAETAKEFWDLLSPEKTLFDEPCKLLFRGQRDATWHLEPSLLRKGNEATSLHGQSTGLITSDEQFFYEFLMLQDFVAHCDSIGISLPGDSAAFRTNHLDRNTPQAFDKYILQPSGWPNPELYEILAIAQHHGLPTRLLDWSKRSYVAAYFAASGALQAYKPDQDDKRLAVWVFNIEQRGLFNDVDIVSVPSGQNRNIASQAGCFSVLRQHAKRAQPFEGTHLLDLHILSKFNEGALGTTPPLLKVSVPVSEAAGILALCKKYGITAATIYPDLYGAATAALDEVNAWKYKAAKRD